MFTALRELIKNAVDEALASASCLRGNNELPEIKVINDVYPLSGN
jgi:hypothetical protein